ncbi:Ankyrin repeat domain-containing protein 42 [Phytophthora boehmeriae]|uniref:Ankyrin repeat domain-containing protein 42 n=1 Tax=Phytophthora boehmeriae TaxID=109152 RepID=A0A8T1WWW8_9STRA|nr:Ankyrin repeat domain-containing protein 42 [Phytophthora boehmeriae]
MSTTGNHFLDFLELGIDCAVSRGLEDMAIYLLSQWKGIKESKDEIAASSAFAFQFSSAFQIACIRSLPTLVAYMIQRGGEQLVDFQWNEGSALVYAFAFGHTNIAAMLLRNGADLTMPTSTYSAPSVRKWVEFGSPRGVRIAWQPRASTEDPRCKRPEFLGPLGAYEESARGLTIDILCQTFSTINLFSDTDEPSLAVSDDTADGNKPHAAIRTEHDDFLTIVESSDLESDGGITNTTREEDNVPAVDIGSPTID